MSALPNAWSGSWGKVFLVLLLSVAAPSIGTGAIDRGNIQGTVVDEQGAVIPGAKVVVKNLATNVETALTTNGAGVYLASELVPGPYSVRVETRGFSPVEVTGINVTANTTITNDISLRVGTTTQTVEVTAAAPAIESTSSNFTTAALEARAINDLPLVGRDIQTLVQLVPGITQTAGPSGAVFGFDSQFGGFPDPLHLVGSTVSANGSQGGANAWYLDGSLNAALGAENSVVVPSQDAVEEFNVVNNGLAPEWGRTSGAIFNTVLKSGTNALHGDVYEFNRNSTFSATNPFARRDVNGRPFLQPRVNFNNMGGTLGGPVVLPRIYNGRNRTFFFISYEGSLLHETIGRILTVPIGQERFGDFRGDPRLAANCDPAHGVTNCIYDPYSTTGPDANGLYHRTPFPTPQIPASRIDPLAAFYAASYPAPNFVDPLQQGPSGCGIYCNNFLGSSRSSQTTHNASIKFDHSFSENQKFFFEWLYNPTFYTNLKYPWNGPTAQTQTGVAAAQPYNTYNQIAAIGLTSTFTPTLINEARFMFSRQSQVATPNPDSVVDNTDVLKHVEGKNFLLFAPYQIVPDIGIGGIGGFGPQQWQNAIQGVQAYTFIDNLTKIVGRHNLKAGMMWRRDNNWNIAAWGYGLGFGGGLTSDPVSGLGGSGLAQFLLGAVDSGSGTGNYHAPWQSNDYWGTYVQDTWRVNNSLSLTYGVRWDFFGWFYERYNDVANFDFSIPNPDLPSARGGIVYFGTPSHPGRTVFPSHKDSLGPRLSFAWQPFNSKKTVIRGGMGLIYSNAISVAMGTQVNSVSAPGFAQYVGYQDTVDFSGQHPAFNLTDGAPVSYLQNFPSPTTAKQKNLQFLGNGAGGGFLNGSRDPYVVQYSFNIQRELPGNFALTVGYVGTHGLHLYGDGYRNYDNVPTAIRLKLRNHINDKVPTDPAIGALYGCGTSCPGYLVLTPYPQYTGVPINTNPDGFSRYNSLQVKAEKRYSHGLDLLVAYTFQKSIDSENTGSLLGNTATPTTLGRNVGRISFVPGASSGATPDRGGAGAEDPDARIKYRALAPDDIPHVLNVAASYELPFGKSKPFLSGGGLADKILGGWKLTQNWNAQSGVPMLISAPGNGVSGRPDLIGDPSKGRSQKSRQQLENQWFDPSAFQAPFGSDPAVIAAISSGTADFNTLDAWWHFGTIGSRSPLTRMPGFWNVDTSLAKEIHFTESRRLQFRWDMFNALNHQNLGVPNTGWCLPPNPDGSTDVIHIFGCQFGKITNVQTDPRSMQFALKFYF
jgi:carboxypeptidase family protein